jgi:hypothetical protein
MAAARAALAVLAGAEGSVDLAAYGYAAHVSDECKAYKALLAEPERLCAMRPQLEQLTREGSGARRVYAALLLERIDPAAGRAALMTMRGSDEPCALHTGGCVITCMWLGETVDYFLGGELGIDPRRAIDDWLDRLERDQGTFVRDFDALPARPRLRAVEAFPPLQRCELEPLATRRPRLEAMLRGPDPMLRLYAALLLERLDPSGRALLALANDDCGLFELDATGQTWTTVAAIARSYLHPARLGALPATPPRPRPKPSSGWFSRVIEQLFGL